MHQYRYTHTHGWQPPTMVPHGRERGRDLSAYLAEAGYRILAQNTPGRCEVGHLLVWQHPEPDDAWPRWAIELDQLDAPCVVWIDAYPDLLEFLARYAPIGALMAPLLPGDLEDLEPPDCPDCGEPMRLVSDNDPPWTDHDDA